MTFYSELAADAADLIAEFGQPVTLTRSVPGAYDTATGTNGASTVTTQACLAVEDAYKAREIDGTLVRVGDRRLILSPETSSGTAVTAAEPGDTITFADGTVWTVKTVEPTSPGGTALIYTLQLRRG